MDKTLDLFMKSGGSAFAIDDAQKIVLWNRCAEKMTGYAAYETIGEPCWRVLQGCDIGGHNFCRPNCPVIEQIRQGDSPPAFNMLITHNHGHTVPVNVGTIYRQGNGLPGRLIHLLWPTVEAELPDTKQLRVQLFGVPSVHRPDGTLVEGSLWQRVKVRALFVFLLLNERQSVDRQTLLRTFWPDLSRKQALHNLNTTIYNLRRSLEPDLARGSRSQYIRYQAGRYSIRKKNSSVDVLDFMQHIKNGQIEIDPRQALSQYQQAVELYQGGCLDEFIALGDWFGRKQKRIDGLYIGALEAVAGLQLELGYMEPARQSYLEVLALDPLRRHSRRQLFHLLATENETLPLQAQNILDAQIDLQMRLHEDEKIG